MIEGWDKERGLFLLPALLVMKADARQPRRAAALVLAVLKRCCPYRGPVMFCFVRVC